MSQLLPEGDSKDLVQAHEIAVPAPRANSWKMAFALGGSTLLSIAAFSLSQYLTARGLVSIPLARILLIVVWGCLSTLVVIVVNAFNVKRRGLTICFGITVPALLLGGLETWATMRNRATIDDKEFLDIVTAWGVKPLPPGSDASEGYEEINTARLQPFKDKFDLMLVARPHDTRLSAFKDHDITKSNPFPIPLINATPMRMTVALPSLFLTSILNGQITELEFHLCLIPHGVDPSTIAELDDVTAKGGHVFTPAHGGGVALGVASTSTPLALPSSTAHSVISETSTRSSKDESHHAVTIDVYLAATSEVQVHAAANLKITWGGKVIGNSHGPVNFESKDQIQVLRTTINFAPQDWTDFTSGTKARPVVEILVEYKDRSVNTRYTIKGKVDSNSDHLLDLNTSYCCRRNGGALTLRFSRPAQNRTSL